MKYVEEKKKHQQATTGKKYHSEKMKRLKNGKLWKWHDMVLIVKSLGRIEISPNNEAKVQLAKYLFLSQT